MISIECFQFCATLEKGKIHFFMVRYKLSFSNLSFRFQLLQTQLCSYFLRIQYPSALSQSVLHKDSLFEQTWMYHIHKNPHWFYVWGNTFFHLLTENRNLFVSIAKQQMLQFLSGFQHFQFLKIFLLPIFSPFPLNFSWIFRIRMEICHSVSNWHFLHHHEYVTMHGQDF